MEECNIINCPRNEIKDGKNICELSRLPKGDGYYTEPLKCAHYQFIKKEKWRLILSCIFVKFFKGKLLGSQNDLIQILDPG